MLFKIKIGFCIVKTDIFHHLPQQFHIVWNFTVFHIVSNEVAKGSSEIFMPWVRQKTPGIGEHAHKTAKQSEI
jgi:hypothetical protein